MDIREIQRMHVHPDGHEVFYNPEEQTLTIANGDTREYVAIPMAAFGLLELAEAASRISKHLIYDEGDQK